MEELKFVIFSLDINRPPTENNDDDDKGDDKHNFHAIHTTKSNIQVIRFCVV
jgi:hypothetical protein